jgi:hypothetical protein
MVGPMDLNMAIDAGTVIGESAVRVEGIVGSREIGMAV